MTDLTPEADGPEEFDSGPGTAIEANVHGSALAATRDFVEEYIKPTFVQVHDPISGIMVPATLDKNGIEAVPVEVFDDYLPNPRDRRGTATLLDLDSFIAFVNRHRDEDSVVFADNDRDRPSFCAILDYNHAGDTTVSARHGRHRALHLLPRSDEWLAWTGANKELMSQADFAKFLEDRIVEVQDPTHVSLSDAQTQFVNRLGGVGRIADHAQLMSLAMNFAVTDVQQVKTATTLQSGEMQIEFASEHVDQAGQKITVPSMIVIAIPVFKGGEPYQILARLRYRILHGSVTFFYELWRTDLVFDHAFKEASERVRLETESLVLLGKPETA